MKLTFSLFPTILDVDFTAPLEKKNFPSSSKLGTHLTPTFTQRIMGRKSFFNSSPPEWNGRCFDSKVWQCFTELFDYLPIAASVRRLELPPIRGVVSVFFYSEVFVKWRGFSWVLCGTSGCWNVQDLPIDVRKKHMEKNEPEDQQKYSNIQETQVFQWTKLANTSRARSEIFWVAVVKWVSGSKQRSSGRHGSLKAQRPLQAYDSSQSTVLWRLYRLILYTQKGNHILPSKSK